VNQRENNSETNSGGESEPPVTVAEFAKELGVCQKTIYREIDRGELPKPSKIGRCSRFARSVVDAYKRKIGLLPPNPEMS
jgi:excisionase family DNA binding protein